MKKGKLFIIIIFLFILAGAVFLILRSGQNFEINPQKKISPEEEFDKKKQEFGGVSPISGLPCKNWQRRPLAVTLAGDAQARPLSGVGQADLVINMPVYEDLITRMLAVFVCEEPEEIGSVRSARHDFIPLAAGLDAIYAHWGGSHFALERLKQGVIDNLDALPNFYNAFYRKSDIVAPHNGFTSTERLLKASQKLGYRLENEFVGYQHLSQVRPESAQAESDSAQAGSLVLSGVQYEYDPAENVYYRWRAGRKEIDKNTGQQVAASNVVIMRASSRQIEGDYNDVDVEGGGACQVYENGEVFDCRWRKDRTDLASKLIFLDLNGAEIKFVPGQIWIEIVSPEEKVNWEIK